MSHRRSEPELTLDQRALLDGNYGNGSALAMRVIVELSRVLGARRLVRVEAAHIDGCLYHGQVGIDFVRRLLDGEARVRVPTTLNVGSLDLVHPSAVRSAPEQRHAARALMDGYVALGGEPTWTCAPYQLPRRPGVGSHVAWAESNAIVFVNSVLGARTDRYGDFVDICAAVTGYAPYAGLHLEANRRARVVVDCGTIPGSMFDVDIAWAALGHLIGRRLGTEVPVLTGLPVEGAAVSAFEDRLKALGAAAASAGGIALFHVVGLTPEAPDIDTALHRSAPDRRIRVTTDDLLAARDELSTVDARHSRVDAVSVGTPHFSKAEFRDLAALLADDRPFATDVEFWISTSRSVLADAERVGDADICRRAGARILVDTCTYIAPVLRSSSKVVMTNSAKLAWYAPANLGVEVVFATLAECVASARAGRVVYDPSSWRLR